MKYDIPGVGEIELRNVVFDLNGTLAVDGRMSDSVKEKIRQLAGCMQVIIATSDIHHTGEALAHELGVQFHALQGSQVGPQKAALVQQLGSQFTAAIGNGSNDAAMLKAAVIGIAILGREGAAIRAIQSADLVVQSPEDAIDCLLHPKRLAATLRE